MNDTKGSFVLKNRDQDYISNIYAYIGYAHMSKTEFNLALDFFNKSDAIFSSLPPSDERVHFHKNIVTKLVTLEMQVSKNLPKGFKHLERLRNMILSNSRESDHKKLKDLVVLLLEYEMVPSNF